jgi:pimeloyl-ACP methyl ester carboxylesterase
MRGAGDPVVFLHGAPTGHDLFDAFADRVGCFARAVLVSMPGYGESPALHGPWTLADQQAAIEEALVANGVTEASFVGFCSGAYHAFAIACRGRVRARAIISLAGFLDFSPEERGGMRQLAGLIAQGVDLREIAVARWLSEGARTPENLAAVEEWTRGAPIAVQAAEIRAFAECEDISARVAKLDVPVVARVGKLDAACPLSKSEAIARTARHARLETVEGVGHALTLEDAPSTIASIESALGAGARRP